MHLPPSIPMTTMNCEPKRVRLLSMLLLTAAFFVVEVVVSRLTGSLAMLSDSFQMLSDVMALLVGLVAVRFAGRTQATNKNTFGWIRAEVMGALVNAVFLTALCFTIVLQAVTRFMDPHEIELPHMVIGVGAGGLLINLVGLCVLGGHRRSHGAHKDVRQADNSEVQVNGSAAYEELETSQSSASQLNMRGVFLHMLGDAMGSVIVVVNTLIFLFVWKPCSPGELCVNPCTDSHCTDHRHVNHTLVDLLGNSTQSAGTAGPCWVLYLDPTLCLIMVCILLYTTYPLLKESAFILLQTVPKQIDVHQLSEKLQRLDGVLAVHELHIWQLAGSRIIATAHVKCHDPASYMEVAKRLKDFFHNEGIHATTIQPEFVTVNSESRTSLCELSCLAQCAPKLCCRAMDKAGLEQRLENRAPALEVIVESQESSGRDPPPSASSIQVAARQEPEVVLSL